MKKYLVCYDYGQGGNWAVIHARSADEIEVKYPDLKIFLVPPEFMTDDELKRIESACALNIDDEPSGWLAEYQKRHG